MISRAEKYSKEELGQSNGSMPTRCSRNSRLYKEVYGKYGNLDNLPIEDNTDEIDMERLKELVSHKESPKQLESSKENLNILEKRKQQVDEQKIYDINQILEKAKYENNKLKDPRAPIAQESKHILSTLESTELSLKDIQKAKEKFLEPAIDENKGKCLEEALLMTRELKNKNLMETETTASNSSDMVTCDNLSLDLFQDLKPTSNTITTKPIQEDEQSDRSGRMDPRSEDTRDIDIIKMPSKKVDNDFFTSSYEFSKKDFSDEDDLFENSKHVGLLKIILLMLMITVFIGVIVYFIGTYGLGIS